MSFDRILGNGQFLGNLKISVPHLLVKGLEPSDLAFFGQDQSL